MTCDFLSCGFIYLADVYVYVPTYMIKLMHIRYWFYMSSNLIEDVDK